MSNYSVQATLARRGFLNGITEEHCESPMSKWNNKEDRDLNKQTST